MQTRRSFLRFGFGVLAFSLLPAAVGAQETVSVPATAASIIQADGPKQGSNSDRFFNVEGKGKGKYACYGVLRFDLSSLKSSLDKKYGAGKYAITGVSLQLAQSNAAFTGSGAIKFFFTPDDTTPPGSLKYPYDPKGSTLKGTLLSTDKFVKETPADYNLFKGQSATGDFAKHLLQGKTLTLVVAEGEDNVAATWAGQKPPKSLKPPTLVVKAVPGGK